MGFGSGSGIGLTWTSRLACQQTGIRKTKYARLVVAFGLLPAQGIATPRRCPHFFVSRQLLAA